MSNVFSRLFQHPKENINQEELVTTLIELQQRSIENQEQISKLCDCVERLTVAVYKLERR